MPGRKRAIQEGKIVKAEDREWRRWFNNLDSKEHEQKLAMLGLDKEDISEWEHHTVFKDIEEELGSGEATEAAPKAKKLKKNH
jgi:hypothetical protein